MMPQTFPWIEQPYLQYAQKDPESNKEKNNKVLYSSNGKSLQGQICKQAQGPITLVFISVSCSMK